MLSKVTRYSLYGRCSYQYLFIIRQTHLQGSPRLLATY